MSVQLLVLDVDGVLTDGRVFWSDTGEEPLRAFHVHDGLAIQWFRRHLGEVAILTAKETTAVRRRAAELDLAHVIQGSRDKAADLQVLADRVGVPLTRVAMMGDDFPDLPAMHLAGYPLAPANAVAEVRGVARLVTRRAGGNGAVREAVEHLLAQAGHWQAVRAEYGLAARTPHEGIQERHARAEDGPRS